VQAEQLIDLDPIVAIHIVRCLDLVGGVDDGHLLARRLSGRENAIDVVDGQKLFEIVWPVPRTNSLCDSKWVLKKASVLTGSITASSDHAFIFGPWHKRARDRPG